MAAIVTVSWGPFTAEEKQPSACCYLSPFQDHTSSCLTFRTRGSPTHPEASPRISTERSTPGTDSLSDYTRRGTVSPHSPFFKRQVMDLGNLSRMRRQVTEAHFSVCVCVWGGLWGFPPFLATVCYSAKVLLSSLSSFNKCGLRSGPRAQM